MIAKLVSGGQSGLDRAALDAALELNVPCGGWHPKGRKAEDGTIPERYPLQETPSGGCSQRTRWNVRDSDATLILTWGEPTGGTLLTVSDHEWPAVSFVSGENWAPITNSTMGGLT